MEKLLDIAWRLFLAYLKGDEGEAESLEKQLSEQCPTADVMKLRDDVLVAVEQEKNRVARAKAAAELGETTKP